MSQHNGAQPQGIGDDIIAILRFLLPSHDLTNFVVEYNREVARRQVAFGAEPETSLKIRSSFEATPAELLEPIFRNLDTWDLLAVALTCKSFAGSAKELLYKSITFEISGADFKNTLTSLQVCLHKSAFVKSLADGSPICRQGVRDILNACLLWRRIAFSEDRHSITSFALLMEEAHVEEMQKQGVNAGYLAETILNALPSERFAKLKIPYKYLKLATRFAALQEIEIRLTGADLEEQELCPTVRYPLLKRLTILCTEQTSFGPRVRFTLETFFAIISQVPTINHLELELKHQSDYWATRAHSLAVFEPETLHIFKNYTIPALSSISVSDLGPEIANVPVWTINSDGSSTIYTVYGILARFFNRHLDRVNDITWLGLINQNSTMANHESMDRVSDARLNSFTNMRSIDIGPRGDCYRAGPGYLGKNDYDPEVLTWCDAFSRDLNPGLSDLTLRVSRGETDDFSEWIKTLLPSLQQVRRLRLQLRNVGPLELEEMSLQWLLELIPVDRPRDLVRYMPQNLENLEVTSSPDDYLKLLDIRPDFGGIEEMFAGLSYLNSFTLGINCKNLGDCNQLVVRRRPRDCMKSDPDQKKLCAWHLGTIHGNYHRLEDAAIEGTWSGHRVLRDYQEIILPEQLYHGMDGTSWTMDRDDIRRIRRCRQSPSGSCDNLILEKGL